MKKEILGLMTAACLSAAVSTCAFAADYSVSTDGSTSMEKTIGSLGEAFMEKFDGAAFTYNPTGSGSGIAAAKEGRCDIGLSSRALTDEEKQDLDGTTIALDGIVIVGADAPVVLIGREAGSGTRDGFETVTGTKDQCKYRQELTATGDVITTVSQNPNAIGYASLAALSDKVKAVTVDGVTASEETVQDGSYKVQRPFVFVTRKGEKLSEGAQAFFDFSFSDEAKPIIIQSGVVPLN